MNRSICLMAPRLDVTFKQGPVPEQKGPISPIREHWRNFALNMIGFVANNEDKLVIEEMPLWQMTPEVVNKLADKHDILLMPHKQRGDDYWHPNIYFYMQTVFPERFTVDHTGWGANLSFLPIAPRAPDNVSVDYFLALKERIDSNVSKFDQPPLMPVAGRFDILFVCQIPHDETIKYHSNISVADTLFNVLHSAKKRGMSVLVKGHPVNPTSMESLRNITDKFDNATWTDSMSIHMALQICDSVALVNSGVGFEAMLHEKPIYSYGRSEYQNVVHFNKVVDNDISNVVWYPSFLFDFFEGHTLNTQDSGQFCRVLSTILN